MSIKAAKVALTKSEINFFTLCSDVFQAFGLDGLIDLARNTPCTNARDEVFFAICQDVFVTLLDQAKGEAPCVSLEGLYRVISSDFRGRSNGEAPKDVDYSDWNDVNRRVDYVRAFFFGRSIEGLVRLRDMPDTITVRFQRSYYISMANAVSVFRI